MSTTVETNLDNAPATTSTPDTTTTAAPVERKTVEEVLEVVGAHAKERKSTAIEGAVAISTPMLFEQSAEQKKFNLISGTVEFKVAGSEKPQSLRFTSTTDIVGTSSKPAFGVGDSISFSVTADDSKYGYRARLTAVNKALSFAQQQQFEMIAKLGIKISIN